LRIEDLQAFGSVAIERRVDLETDEPFWGKAGAEIAEIGETADEESRAYQEEKGKRYLGDDEGFS
jgi:hypothetical protein